MDFQITSHKADPNDLSRSGKDKDKKTKTFAFNTTSEISGDLSIIAGKRHKIDSPNDDKSSLLREAAVIYMALMEGLDTIEYKEVRHFIDSMIDERRKKKELLNGNGSKKPE